MSCKHARTSLLLSKNKNLNCRMHAHASVLGSACTPGLPKDEPISIWPTLRPISRVRDNHVSSPLSFLAARAKLPPPPTRLFVFCLYFVLLHGFNFYNAFRLFSLLLLGSVLLDCYYVDFVHSVENIYRSTSSVILIFWHTGNMMWSM